MTKLLNKNITDFDVKNSQKALDKMKKIISCDLLTNKAAREEEQNDLLVEIKNNSDKIIRKISIYSATANFIELFEEKNILDITVTNKDIKQLMKFDFIRKEHEEDYE